MSKKIEDFGKVVENCQSVYNYEFKITDGFSGKMEDTMELMAICKKEAEGYSIVKKMNTDVNLFHLILSVLGLAKLPNTKLQY